MLLRTVYLIIQYIGFVCLTLLFACTQEQKERVIPVNDFFKTQDRAFYRISPNGTSLAYLKIINKRQDLFVEDLQSGKVTQITKLKDKGVSFYAWISNDELIFYKARSSSRFHDADLYILNKDGSNLRPLIADDNSEVDVIQNELIDNKYLLITSNKRDSTVFDVYRLNVKDGKMEMAAQNPGNITDWFADSKGRLRLATVSDGVNKTFLYRENEKKPFKAVITNNFKNYIEPIAFDEKDSNVVYCISSVNRDKNALVTIDFKTGKEKQVLFASDSLHVTEAVYSKSRKRIVSVICETWKRERFYLDQNEKKLYLGLEKLLPNTAIRIINKDNAEKVCLVRTYTDKSPGSYYIYYVTDGKLRKLSDINPSININEMCEMRPISYKSRDGLTINGYLTLPKNKTQLYLPVVVLPHDGPIGRDTWEYMPEVQFLANRGYAVMLINYRGSTGYGKAFYLAGFKQWGAKVKDDINDGVKWLIDKKIADPNRIAIYGNRFGGYIALNCMYSSPGLYACGGANCGTINLFGYLKTIPPFHKAYLQMYYELIGDPIQDADYLRQVSPVFHPDKFSKPLFIAQTRKNYRVNVPEGIQFVKELRKMNVPVTYLENEETSSMAIKNENRQQLYKALEEFLRKNMGNN